MYIVYGHMNAFIVLVSTLYHSQLDG